MYDHKLYMKQWHEKNKDHSLAYGREYHKKNRNMLLVRMKRYRTITREVRLAQLKDWHKAHPEATLKSRLKSYHLTVEQYQLQIEKQAHKCASCQDLFVGTPCIDHDHTCCPTQNHSCGKCIRGIICQSCNKVLGFAKDSKGRLHYAINYLAQYEDSKVYGTV
jgi:Recombination endonuclease VII